MQGCTGKVRGKKQNIRCICTVAECAIALHEGVFHSYTWPHVTTCPVSVKQDASVLADLQCALNALRNSTHLQSLIIVRVCMSIRGDRTSLHAPGVSRY